MTEEQVMAHAVLKNPGGDELVLLSRTEYERLVEDSEMLADIAAYDAAKARLADGRDELVPASVLDAMLDGESPVRVWRQHRGLTIAQLAEKAGLSAAYLSQIETGARAGTVETLGKVAAALGLDLDDLT